MTFLRWMTLCSATLIHENVVLVLRRNPVSPKVNWAERQDFQLSPSGYNWTENLDSLPVTTLFLEDIAPEIAKLQAPDVQTSDLLAWRLLAEYGGTVADMDIVFLKTLPEIRADVEVAVFKEHPKPGYIPVTLMQGRPCSAWSAAYELALHSYQPNGYESCGSHALLPKPKGLLSERIVFPWAGRYPWSKWHNWLFEAKSWPAIPSDCCGIHWYAGHNQVHNQKMGWPGDIKTGAVAWAVRQLIRQAKCPCGGALS